VVKEPSPSTDITFMTPPARARAEIAYSLSPKTSGGDLTDWNTRKRDRIARVEVALSLCMIADRRRHERECGPCSENRCLSGARTKHHL
jgi:hypothetical protein